MAAPAGLVAAEAQYEKDLVDFLRSQGGQAPLDRIGAQNPVRSSLYARLLRAAYFDFCALAFNFYNLCVSPGLSGARLRVVH